MKTCSECGETKERSQFFKRSRSTDGLESCCKVCRKARNDKWFAENKERHHEMTRGWYAENREYHLQKTKERYDADPTASLIKYYRRAERTKKATPRWADSFQINHAYRVAKRLTDETGCKWEVDHVIPLQSKYVCGLHVQGNLEVITAAMNRSKSNSTWPDMP